MKKSIRRNKMPIRAKMLDCCKEPTRATKIMYATYISSLGLKTHLDYLVHSGLLELFVVEEKKYYRVTSEGMEVLKAYKYAKDKLEADEIG